MNDLRDDIFRSLEGKTTQARIIAAGEGLVAGIGRAEQVAQHLDLTVTQIVAEGTRVAAGQTLATVQGAVKPIIIGEERLMGCISKTSGIATAAAEFVQAAGGRPRIVSGAWKKMPFEFKEMLREAVRVGGVDVRICDEPFIYLDKNYVSVFGGVRETLDGVSHMKAYAKVIQLKGAYKDIGAEALDAVRLDARIVFVDTGDLADVASVAEALRDEGLRDRVQIAFGGNVRVAQIEEIRGLEVDIVDIGQAIVDAPLLDLKYEVQTVL